MEFKGTKGKWVAVKNNYYWEVHTNDPSRVMSFGILLFDKEIESLTFTKENEANAKLIAAAPELLKELKRMTLSMQAHPDCEPYSEFQDYVNSAWQAIEKALK